MTHWRNIVAVGLLSIIASSGVKENRPQVFCEEEPAVRSRFTISRIRHLLIYARLSKPLIALITPTYIDFPRLVFIIGSQERSLSFDSNWGKHYINKSVYFQASSTRKLFAPVPVEDERQIPEGKWYSVFAEIQKIDLELDLQWIQGSETLRIREMYATERSIGPTDLEFCIVKDVDGGIEDVHWRERPASVTQRDRR